jgi:hypothetical protein
LRGEAGRHGQDGKDGAKALHAAAIEVVARTAAAAAAPAFQVGTNAARRAAKAACDGRLRAAYGSSLALRRQRRVDADG